MARLLDHGFQLLAGVEGDDAARADRNLLAGLRIAARPLRLVAQLEIAEARELDALAAFKRPANFFEERLHHVLGLALVQPDLLKQQIGQFGLGPSHYNSLIVLWFFLLCPQDVAQTPPPQPNQRVARRIGLHIGEGPFSILHNYPESKAFFPGRQARTLVEIEYPYRPHEGGFFSQRDRKSTRLNSSH